MSDRPIPFVWRCYYPEFIGHGVAYPALLSRTAGDATAFDRS